MYFEKKGDEKLCSLSEKNERKKQKGIEQRKHVASTFTSYFPLSVPSKRTLMLPVGSHSYRTSPFTHTSCFSLLQALLSKEEQGCPEYLQP